jgi:hypothetical protein
MGDLQLAASCVRGRKELFQQGQGIQAQDHLLAWTRRLFKRGKGMSGIDLQQLKNENVEIHTNANEFVRHDFYHLFPQQSAATSLYKIQVRIDFIGSINGNV